MKGEQQIDSSALRRASALAFINAVGASVTKAFGTG